MARASRAKGKRGELEVAALLSAYGFRARRDGRVDANRRSREPWQASLPLAALARLLAIQRDTRGKAA